MSIQIKFNTIRRYRYILIFIAFYISIISIRASFASIGVTPTVTELEVAPGEEVMGFLSVGNDSSETIKVKIEPEEWMKKTTNNLKDYPPVNTWLFFKNINIEIPPKSVRKVEYVIKMPKDYKGELMSEVFFSETTQKKTAIGFTSRFGVAIYAVAKNTAVYNFEITDLNVKKASKTDTKDNSLSFYITIKNNGNAHIRPNSEIFIYDESGNKLNELKFLYGPPVFPSKEREYVVFWKDANLKNGNYKVAAKTTFKDREASKSSNFQIFDNNSVKIVK